MNARIDQQPQTGPRPSGAVILYAIGLVAFFLPSLLWPSSPLDPVAIVFNILVFTLTLYSAYRGQTVIAFFNSICLFFISYPFLLQYAQGIDLTEHGYVRPLSLLTASVYALYLVIVTIGATRTPKRDIATPQQYQIGPRWMLLVSAFALMGMFMALYGTEAIVYSRYEQYLDTYKAEGTALFIRESLRIAPFWLAYMISISSVQKGRGPLSVPFLAAFLLGFFLCNPVNSARFYSLTGIFVALYPTLSYYRLVQWLPVAFPALMTVILPVTSSLRYGLENLTWEGVISIFHSLEFSSFQVLNDGVVYLRELDWGMGIYSLSALLIFVPRSIWLDKNTGTGQTIGEMAAYPISNVGVSPHFDAYMDFGVPGVIVMALLVGLMFRWVYMHSRNRLSFGYTKADISALLLGLIPIFVRGDFSVFTIAFYSFVVAYLVVRLLIWIGSALTVRPAHRHIHA